MTEVVDPVWVNPAVQAEALAKALRQIGFSTTVWKSRDYLEHPCVVVKCATRHLRQTEHIFAAPKLGGDDQFWFWRVSPHDPLTMELIAPISHVSASANLLARTITYVPE
jgi:hypothetical protein